MHKPGLTIEEGQDNEQSVVSALDHNCFKNITINMASRTVLECLGESCDMVIIGSSAKKLMEIHDQLQNHEENLIPDSSNPMVVSLVSKKCLEDGCKLTIIAPDFRSEAQVVKEVMKRSGAHLQTIRFSRQLLEMERKQLLKELLLSAITRPDNAIEEMDFEVTSTAYDVSCIMEWLARSPELNLKELNKIEFHTHGGITQWALEMSKGNEHFFKRIHSLHITIQAHVARLSSTWKSDVTYLKIAVQAMKDISSIRQVKVKYMRKRFLQEPGETEREIESFKYFMKTHVQEPLEKIQWSVHDCILGEEMVDITLKRDCKPARLEVQPLAPLKFVLHLSQTDLFGEHH